jgi:hypothetical protein
MCDKPLTEAIKTLAAVTAAKVSLL